VSDGQTQPYGLRRLPIPEGMSDVERLLAFEEIRQLWARFILCMCARDFKGCSELFIDDYRSWSGKVGREALAAEFEGTFAQLKGGLVTFNMVGGEVINLIDADHAEATVTAMAELGDPNQWILQRIVYDNTYERRNGEWFIATTRHHLVYGAISESRPLSQPLADWPRNTVGVGTVPYCYPTWQAWYRRTAWKPSPLDRIAPPWLQDS
jgi:hypothetical protein